MASIRVTGVTGEYTVSDDRARELKRRWMDGSLPDIVEIGSVAFAKGSLRAITLDGGGDGSLKEGSLPEDQMLPYDNGAKPPEDWVPLGPLPPHW